MLEIFVLIVGVSDSPNSPKVQLVIVRSKKMKTPRRFTRNHVLSHLRIASAGALFIAAIAMVALSSGAAGPKSSIPKNVDVSQRHLNESEEAIAVNPTNPNNIVIFTNIGHLEAGLTAGMFLAVSFDGGATWTTRIVGNNDNLGDACCDPSLSFDEYGNLFMTYLYQVENEVPIALSTDGGLTFNVIQNIAAPPSAPAKKAPGDNRGLFHFVDQPTITAAKGEVWVVFNAGGPIFATGAPVTGLGQVGKFFAGEVVPVSPKRMSADSTLSRHSRTALWMPKLGLRGIGLATRTTAACTRSTLKSRRTRATTRTSTSATLTTTALRGARACA